MIFVSLCIWFCGSVIPIPFTPMESFHPLIEHAESLLFVVLDQAPGFTLVRSFFWFLSFYLLFSPMTWRYRVREPSFL